MLIQNTIILWCERYLVAMKLRYARHTNKLEDLKTFYTQVLGLEVLGHFENHNRYDGIFLGFPDLDWHLEFTQSNQMADHQPDADDLLVLYFQSHEKIQAIIEKAQAQGIEPTPSQNPYWQKNGTELKDPDGYGVMLTLEKRN